ncbi:low molecular weight phosphotyrosine protein phosphatase [Pseudomonas sp. GD03842]|uniref:low molecular weight protein-tyrosine-phosphatase n=1 Tax=unclassified Pseudomonas TaxID=196821 RepID=UPI000D36DB40|nr:MULTISPECIES: low molecular weight protein-tyrosine-phosphatase [unclassified Pseudomonas]MDH0749613.1 low molecular weight phosphotyrosine protein phosphatase [Pseudomonas sp. GD03842]RAU47308.1 low molecular weight phosphotyrosine protein phosphatase [Pseudomonas sp. RIT 409]RAU52018.1 low molecular weight phosphotyrosine protein phosphatase [Pseudomonas sp. RIT 412]
MFSNVLVVCVGNICRSPMAEAMFRQRVLNDRITVSSAGTHAMLSSTMDPLARAVLHVNGVEAHRHRSRQIDRQMLHEADLILLMEHRQAQSVLKLAPEVRGKTFLIGKWQQDMEIADPYRRPKLAFEQTYELLSRCVDDWLPYLQSGDSR